VNLKPESRLGEAKQLLQRLEFDGPRCNDRSGLTLLALAKLRPDDRWSRATNPLLGTRAIMDFMAAHYDKHYAPNSRETIRRATLHQFVDAGLVLHNPDDLSRPVNSDRTRSTNSDPPPSH
jgi:adenine-specific DNA-methyltransferase